MSDMRHKPGPFPDADLGNCPGILAARLQRNQALGCLWLSLVVSSAVLISNLGDHSAPWARLQPLIKSHQQMLSSSKQLLQVNKVYMSQVKLDLERVRSATKGTQW